jgi:hypothetical protein
VAPRTSITLPYHEGKAKIDAAMLHIDFGDVLWGSRDIILNDVADSQTALPL